MLRTSLFLLPLLLLLASCVPALEAEGPEAIIPGARFATAPFVDPASGATYATGFEAIGRGAPVVMVHGIGGGSSLFQYRLNAPAVADAGYAVYALDLLGFGRSSRPAIRSTQDLLVAQVTSFLEDVVGEPAVVVANGLAAAHAIRIAAERPELVAGLVLIAPTGYRSLNRPQDADRVRAFDLLANPVIGQAFAGALLSPAAQEFFLLDAYQERESLTPEVRASYDRNLRVADARWVVFSFVSGNLDQDVSELWPATTQEALLVWGSAPGFSSYADAEDFVLARPDARLLVLRDAALLPNEERADAFNGAVLDFLQRIGW
ncbi:MAG: alpha/beta fold hydrolase [Trueperaceae bacterium]|nr:alpha/beta fold hydrolase [Trueperaceae bacterium]